MAPDLLNKLLVHDRRGGRIVEVETYRGPMRRNRVMFGPAGRLCVGTVRSTVDPGGSWPPRALRHSRRIDAEVTDGTASMVELRRTATANNVVEFTTSGPLGTAFKPSRCRGIPCWTGVAGLPHFKEDRRRRAESGF